MSPTKTTKKRETAHERRVRRFEEWLLDNNACALGRHFAEGLTVHEAWKKGNNRRKLMHGGFMRWFASNEDSIRPQWYAATNSLNFNQHLDLSPEDIRKLVKLPTTFPWER